MTVANETMFYANQLIGKHREVEPHFPQSPSLVPGNASFQGPTPSHKCPWRWDAVLQNALGNPAAAAGAAGTGCTGCSVEAEAQGLLSEASASLVGDARAGKGAEFTKNERCPKICIVLVGLKMMTSHVLAKFVTTPHGTPKCAPENSRSSRTKSRLCQLLGVCTSEFITGWK